MPSQSRGPGPQSSRREDLRVSRAVWLGGRGRGVRVREAHESRAFLVVELEPQGADAVPERERRRVVEDRVLVVGALEVVVGDAGAQMVDMVEPDVSGEELKDRGQL